MKILRAVKIGHDCIAQIHPFLVARGLGIGTVVECDCERVWRCEGLQADGSAFMELTPREALRVEEERWRG